MRAAGSRAGGRMSSDTACRCARSPLKSSGVVVLKGDRFPHGRARRRAPSAPCSRGIQPAARAGRVRERNGERAVELVRAADAVGETAPDAEHGADRKAADRHDQLRPDQLQLPLAPEGAELLLAGRRRPISGDRTAGARDSNGSPRRSRTSGRSRLRPTRASGAASCRRDRATGGALLLDDARRLPVHVAPVGRGTRSRRARTRADSRPRHTPGRHERRVAARRVSGRTERRRVKRARRGTSCPGTEARRQAPPARSSPSNTRLYNLPARPVLELTLLPALRRVTLTADGGDDDEAPAPPAALSARKRRRSASSRWQIVTGEDAVEGGVLERQGKGVAAHEGRSRRLGTRGFEHALAGVEADDLALADGE